MKKVYLEESFKNHKIELRKHSPDLAKTMFNYIDRDRKRLREFLLWVDNNNSIQDQLDYINFTHQKWNQYELFDFGIFDTKNNYLGNIGVHTIDWENNCCEIGYWIIGKFEGQGFISSALKLLEKHLFDKGFNRIEIRCSSLNQRSENITKYNGYLLEGELRENSIEYGKYRNTKIFSKLKSTYYGD